MSSVYWQRCFVAFPALPRSSQADAVPTEGNFSHCADKQVQNMEQGSWGQDAKLLGHGHLFRFPIGGGGEGETGLRGDPTPHYSAVFRSGELNYLSSKSQCDFSDQLTNQWAGIWLTSRVAQLRVLSHVGLHPPPPCFAHCHQSVVAWATSVVPKLRSSTC